MFSLLHLVRDRCVTDPWLLAAILLTNLWIAGSYLAIPAALDRIRSAAGPGAPAAAELRWASMFIRSCGMTHLFGVAVLFAPGLDWPASAWALWTAAISWFTYLRLRAARRDLAAALTAARALAERLDGTVGP